MILLIVFVIITIQGFKYLMSVPNNLERTIYIPFLMLLFYGVILVTIQGALFWLLLGFALTLTDKNRTIR